MGGNVKNAFTETVTEKVPCQVCGHKFERKYSSSTKVCDPCETRLSKPENLEQSIEISFDGTRKATITVTLESTIHESIGVPVPTDSVENSEVIGLLQVESNTGFRYEDAWVETPKIGTTVEVRRGETSFEFELDEQSEQEESVRSEYQSSVGDLFDGETLDARFSFVSDEIPELKSSAKIPSHLIQL